MSGRGQNSHRVLLAAAVLVSLLIAALAVAQTRPAPPARAPGVRRTAPAPLPAVKMFRPGSFPVPPHVLSSGTGGAIPTALTAFERQQVFQIGPNAPAASLGLAHMVEPGKAALRLVAPQYAGNGEIMVWPADSGHPQSYVCLDLYPEANKTYFMDVTFLSPTPDAKWEVYGPDSQASMEFPGKARTIQHLTFGFTNTGGPTNTGKPGYYLFTLAAKQESIVYRMDVYVK